MTPGRQSFIVALFLIAATVLQGYVAHAVKILGAEPDFVIVVLACGATLVGGSYAVATSVWAGLLEASLFSLYTGSYLTSRTLAGAFAGSMKQNVIRDSVLVPPLVVLLTTAVSDLVFAAMCPPVWKHHAHQWVHATIGQVIYNTALAHPVYYFLRRCHVGQPKENPFGRVR